MLARQGGATPEHGRQRMPCLLYVALVFLNVRDVVSRAQRSADGSNVVVFHGVVA